MANDPPSGGFEQFEVTPMPGAELGEALRVQLESHGKALGALQERVEALAGQVIQFKQSLWREHTQRKRLQGQIRNLRRHLMNAANEIDATPYGSDPPPTMPVKADLPKPKP